MGGSQSDQRAMLARILCERATTDPDLLVLTADMGTRIVPEFVEQHPGRFLNLGVAEQNLVACAAGLARLGFTPVVTTIAAFLSMRALEQIRTDVAYPALKVIMVGTGGGVAYGNLGATHFGLEDLAIFRVIPNLTVLCPADAAETAWALEEAFVSDGPVYIRLDRGPITNVYTEEPPPRGLSSVWLIGRGAAVDVLLIATGTRVQACLEAAKMASSSRLRIGVVNARTIKPFDHALLIEASQMTDRLIITVEDHTTVGGLGSAVAQCLAVEPTAHRVPIISLGIPDTFPHGTHSASDLYRRYGLDAALIARRLVEYSDVG